MGREGANAGQTNSSLSTDAVAEGGLAGGQLCLDKLIADLFINPDVARIRPGSDPRFRWLTTDVQGGA